MGPGPAAQTVQELTAALPGEIGAEQDALLERVARREATLADFLAQFGHRAAGEMELMTPRWREQPDEIESFLASLRSETGPWPSARRATAAQRREEACRNLPALLAAWGGSSQETEIVAQVREAQALLPYRERGRHFLMAGHELLRSVAVELGRRWELGEAVFFLEAGELSRFEAERDVLLPRLEQRREERAAVRRIELSDVIDSMQLHRLGQSPPPLLAKGDWQGAPLAAGLGEGPVFVTREAADLVEFRGGEVLVCPSTDPGWMPLLLRARALVVERGGMLSHGAIVARDLGLPAVVLPGATELLHAGQTVRVDGHTGSITLVPKEAHD
jgi:pyruvate,water dikinase